MNQFKWKTCISHRKTTAKDSSSKSNVARVALCAAHCYLLHSEDVEYQQSGHRKRFEAALSMPILPEEEEKKEDIHSKFNMPPSIDFGVHVLQWLPHGHHPYFNSFKEEMIKNPASTLSLELWEEFCILCIALIDGRIWTMNHLDEVMCLKLYSDCTKLQSLFRKAHWKSTPLAIKKQFYQWALLMYQTFLYHARPLPTVLGGITPTPLYHGLIRLFALSHTAPLYHGPFSTTISTHIANTFANGQGLVFNVKGSYTNPLRFIIGMNMVRISCFKHEKEILLYSQTLPIQSTKTYEQDHGILVHHMLCGLKTWETVVTDVKAFFRQMGVRFNPQWWSIIVTHPVLLEKSVFRKETVLDRLLSKHFDIEKLTGEIWSEWQIIRQSFDRNDFDTITSDGSTISLPEDQIQRSKMKALIYSLAVDEHTIGADYHFDGNGCFHFESVLPVHPRRQHAVHLKVKPTETSSQFATVKQFQSAPFAKYDVLDESVYIADDIKVTEFNEKADEGGTIEIQSSSDIKVTASGGINANDSGMKQADTAKAYQVHCRQRLLDSTKYGDWDVVLLTFGFGTRGQDQSDHSGGGVIALRSSHDIVNDGSLSSNGSAGSKCGGGSISLCAANAVINRGQIQCVPNGRIIVQCSQFVNVGVMCPVPDVIITDETEQRKIEIVKLPWSGCKFKRSLYPSIHTVDIIDL